MPGRVDRSQPLATKRNDLVAGDDVVVRRQHVGVFGGYADAVAL